MKDTSSIAIIGAGNMGSALLSGLIAHGFPAESIWVSNPTIEKLTKLKAEFPIHITQDNKEAAQNADIIILSVEPTTISIVTKELSTVVDKTKHLIISVAAGIPSIMIQKSLGGASAIIRAMPNTASLVQASATALYKNIHVTDEQKNKAESIFRGIGTCVWLEDEKLLDAVTALSGCGPAYFFLVMEILQQVGEQMGLSRDIARVLTLQTAYGSAKMALENKHDAVELRRQVTSKGGSTEAAIKVLEAENIRGIFQNALTAALKRAEERSKES